MKYLDYLGDSYSEESQEFDSEKAKRFAFKERGNLNIVLRGATGTGKSSLVNAMFGSNVVKSGSGEPVTQYLEKIHVPAKGITLWDTKGIEAKDYHGMDLNRHFHLVKMRILLMLLGYVLRRLQIALSLEIRNYWEF